MYVCIIYVRIIYLTMLSLAPLLFCFANNKPKRKCMAVTAEYRAMISPDKLEKMTYSYLG
jgi:hypothetical protein